MTETKTKPAPAKQASQIETLAREIFIRALVEERNAYHTEFLAERSIADAEAFYQTWNQRN